MARELQITTQQLRRELAKTNFGISPSAHEIDDALSSGVIRFLKGRIKPTLKNRRVAVILKDGKVEKKKEGEGEKREEKKKSNRAMTKKEKEELEEKAKKDTAKESESAAPKRDRSYIPKNAPRSDVPW